jgi:hypothetical protein
MVDPRRDDILAPSSAPQQDQMDRRRPGRREDVSPHLLPLLRNPASVEIPPDEGSASLPPRDDRAAAKGLLMALLLAIPLWCLIGLGIWWAVG